MLRDWTLAATEITGKRRVLADIVGVEVPIGTKLF